MVRDSGEAGNVCHTSHVSLAASDCPPSLSSSRPPTDSRERTRNKHSCVFVLVAATGPRSKQAGPSAGVTRTGERRGGPGKQRRIQTSALEHTTRGCFRTKPSGRKSAFPSGPAALAAARRFRPARGGRSLSGSRFPLGGPGRAAFQCRRPAPGSARSPNPSTVHAQGSRPRAPWRPGLRVACRPDAESQPEAPEEPGSRPGPPLPSVSQLPPPPRPWGSAVGRSTLDCAADRRPRRSGSGSEGVGGGAAAAREPLVERGALSVRACR
ncbi:hypothetical protein J1605_004608 [Eschrichtius robustus]|uniref:Uncharacterized protein n=1 Tax=Eschrichtius robustus TaxID=9764 RepID=A0AB34HIM9_ESCRO|nr:hypothetical protein J1605_004608 [Eschrichtius robustus]